MEMLLWELLLLVLMIGFSCTAALGTAYKEDLS
jgi:hypothetical protein